jgi:hypothetical protein
MNLQFHNCLELGNALETWLHDHAGALYDMARTLTAGPIALHFSAADLYTIMTRKIWTYSIFDSRFFFSQDDTALLKSALTEAITALLAGSRYNLNIRVIL